ncbi:alpha/beta hydrolase-fold protein [Gramella sp. AN32]|uniref:Alpha/beta hydrolase n=1 Tax=Christiangramia antarctica TaxID=2058158 RepID=A0ABW5X9U3_9FLAO|nr:alpha/beta hydrolase-fold protein [Gramella sp. AN32]MCM4154490.1 alpha-mannosidase [Gramella sp. AN32]
MKQTLKICSLFWLVTQSILAQHSASPQVSTFSIEAPQLDTIKKIWVYLPKAYNDAEKTFPVIYMHDAQNLFDNETSFVGEWNVDESLDSLRIPPAIIVGIEHGNAKRLEELTPFPNEKYGGGKAIDYLNFIRNTLKPHIDATYRTLPDRKNTGIWGSSLGGLTSFYATFYFPEVFGFAGVYSPSFWYSDEIYTYVSENEIPDTKYYFLVGDKESEDMVTDLEKMLQLLESKGLAESNFQVKIVKDGEHNEKLWREGFLETYLWLMPQKE